MVHTYSASRSDLLLRCGYISGIFSFSMSNCFYCNSSFSTSYFIMSDITCGKASCYSDPFPLFWKKPNDDLLF